MLKSNSQGAVAKFINRGDCPSTFWLNRRFSFRSTGSKKLLTDWRGGEAVTQGSAKPPCTGSIPVRASNGQQFL